MSKQFFCQRCYHTWKPRKKETPKICPECKSKYWNLRLKTKKKVVVPTKDLIIKIHDDIIKKSGGELGIRDDGGIYNSITKLFNNHQKYKNNPESIGTFALNEFAKRHYFVDGNKRTAYAIAKIFMLINRCHLKIKYTEAAQFIIKIAEYQSKVDFNEIRSWIKSRCAIITEKELENYLSRNYFEMLFEKEEEDWKNE